VQLPIDRVAVMDNAGDTSCRLSESHRFMKMMSAKRFGVCEELNSLQPICFSLSVVTEEDVYARRAIDLSGEVAEAVDFDRFQKHCRILAYACGVEASQKKENERRKPDARCRQPNRSNAHYNLIGITIYL
jgi:hypothetical protein